MPRATANRALIQCGSSGRCVSCRVAVAERTVLRDILNTPRVA
jgi:ferredoxin